MFCNTSDEVRGRLYEVVHMDLKSAHCSNDICLINIMHDLMQNLAIASVLLLNYISWTILFKFVSLYKVLLSVIKLFTGYLSAYHFN